MDHLVLVTVALAVVFCCQKGMAQLCANERMCEVSINATQSFQQYQLNDGVKICFSCLFNGIIETDTTWFIDDSPDIPLTTGANPFGTNNNGVLEICNTTDILDRVADATPRFVCQSLNASASHSLFITLRALNPPSITPLVEPIVVTEGLATLELRCLHPDSEPITSEEWRGPDGTVVSTQASLILMDLFRDDTGEYTCTITNDMGETRSTSRTIIVQHAPVASAMQPDPVSLGAMIELVCVAAEGTPPFTYTWSRDSDGTVMFTSTTSGVYSFTAASDSAGSYTCTITNPLGSDNTSVNVFVGFPPTVSPTQSPVMQVVIGANLTLAVDITGFNQPLTAVTWRRGGVELTNDTARVTVINSDLSIAPATSELTVSPVMIPEADGGVYVVSAESPAGTSDVIFYIEVFAPPTITGPQGDMTIDEGAPILLRCTARGFPAPSFMWLQGTTPLTDALPRIAIDGMPFVTYVGGFRVVTSTLEISAAERSDAGSYACVASNNEPDGANGEARSDFTITVNSPPLSTGASVAITAVLCSVAFFALGVLSTLLVVYCLSSTAKRRAQYSVSSTEPAPVYEEISITVTDTKPKAIELSENIAYGPTRP